MTTYKPVIKSRGHIWNISMIEEGSHAVYNCKKCGSTDLVFERDLKISPNFKPSSYKMLEYDCVITTCAEQLIESVLND